VFICEEVANIPRVVRQSRTTELLTAMDIDESRARLLDLLEKLQSDKSPGPDLYIVSPSQSAILPLLGWPLVSAYTMAYCVHGRPTEWDKKPVWYTVSFTAEMRDDQSHHDSCREKNMKNNMKCSVYCFLCMTDLIFGTV